MYKMIIRPIQILTDIFNDIHKTFNQKSYFCHFRRKGLKTNDFLLNRNIKKILCKHRIHDNGAFNTSNANYIDELKSKWKKYMKIARNYIEKQYR